MRSYPKDKLGTLPIKIAYTEWSCGVLVSAVTEEKRRVWAEDLFHLDLMDLLAQHPRWDIGFKRVLKG
jgi:hypothetical protein